MKNAQRKAPVHPAKTTPPAREATLVRERRRIMIVDDHPITRMGLANLINSQADLVVSCEAGDPASAISKLSIGRPDLILADLKMPGRSGTEFIKDLLAFEPHLRILAITMQDEQEYAERVLRAGACGFIMKSAGSESVLAAVRHVLAGYIYVSPPISARLLQTLSRPARQHVSSAVGQLSDREFEVFQLIGEGNESADIAQKLRISRKTVDVHRSAIRRKLGLTNATTLIRHAVRWVESGSDSAAIPAGPASVDESS